MLGNISSHLNIEWFLGVSFYVNRMLYVGAKERAGVPLNDSANLRLEIAEAGMRILGSKLKGLQVGNEPDLYQRHGHRPVVRWLGPNAICKSYSLSGLWTF